MPLLISYFLIILMEKNPSVKGICGHCGCLIIGKKPADHLKNAHVKYGSCRKNTSDIDFKTVILCIEECKTKFNIEKAVA